MARLSYVVRILVLCLISYSYCQQCDQSSDVARFDCYPESGASQDKCISRNCCWRQPLSQKTSTVENLNNIGDVNVPYCYYPKDFPSYLLQTTEQTDFGQRIQINKSDTTYMPNDIRNLVVDLIYETEQRLRIRIYDPMNKRYEVPLQVPVVQKKADTTDYDIKINDQPFSIMVTRKSSGVTL